MRIMLVDTAYAGFVRSAHAARPWLACASYGDQYAAIADGSFHTLSCYTRHLQAAGHEVFDVWANHLPLQSRWCAELEQTALLKHCAAANSLAPYGENARANGVAWFVPVVEAQVRWYRPDVLICGNPYEFEAGFLERCGGAYGRAVLVHAAPLPDHDIGRYDLVISSAPALRAAFSARGYATAHLPLAFDDRVLRHLGPATRRFDLSFVGQVLPAHGRRGRFLLDLGRRRHIDVFGDVSWSDEIAAESKIDRHEALWGAPMYQALRDSQITLNCHIDAAGTFANNIRLYEATGVGTCLLTDRQDDLSDYFDPGKDVLAFSSVDEAIDLINYYLAHDTERAAIAAAGQRRTARDHNYGDRGRSLLALLERT